MWVFIWGSIFLNIYTQYTKFKFFWLKTIITVENLENIKEAKEKKNHLSNAFVCVLLAHFQMPLNILKYYP